MTDDMFDRIRQRRRDALAESLRHRSEHFNPYRCGPILEVGADAEADPARATVTLTMAEGQMQVLPHFYIAHASHLLRLSPADRIEYLRSIWLNYSRAISGKGRPLG